jgi:CheY-like chemotaxis protein
MIRLLGSLGYPAAGFASGAEALAHMRDAKPALVMLDYQMPAMNGLDVLQAMKADATLRDVPVMMRTASEGAIQSAATRAGADAYILKGSLDVAQLEKDLARLIGPP